MSGSERPRDNWGAKSASPILEGLNISVAVFVRSKLTLVRETASEAPRSSSRVEKAAVRFPEVAGRSY